MSNTDIIIPERSRDIGDFLVGRLLPFRKKRMVGPFIFIDHMGPVKLGPKRYMDVDQHPHCGLATLTYLLEGEIQHRDSLGTNQRIKPGSVNWMVAGSGVTHTERSPESLRNGKSYTVHGYQIWVALPEEKENIEPSFHHFAAGDLPQWKSGNVKFKLVAGQGFGRTSPVPVHSNMFMAQVINEGDYTELNLKDQLEGEIGLCVVKGGIVACGNRVEAGNLAVSKKNGECSIGLEPNAHLLIFGGKPFAREPLIHWNFVAHSQEAIEKARQKWMAKEFPAVAGDDTYVPLPHQKN